MSISATESRAWDLPAGRGHAKGPSNTRLPYRRHAGNVCRERSVLPNGLPQQAGQRQQELGMSGRIAGE